MGTAHTVLASTVGELLGSLTVSLALERAQGMELRDQLAQATADLEATRAALTQARHDISVLKGDA